MNQTSAPRQFGDDEFEEIERAVMETTRGRWFLAEFARRIRSAETRQVLETLGRMESMLAKPQARQQPPALPKMTDDAPVDALMQRLQSAISAMSSPAAKETEAAETPSATTKSGPETLAAVDAMSPADRLKLFY